MDASNDLGNSHRKAFLVFRNQTPLCLGENSLLKGLPCGAATLENGMEVSQKVKPPYDPAIATLDIYLKNVMIKRSTDQEIALQIHMHPIGAPKYIK